MKTAFVFSSAALRYDLGQHHPFKAIRPEAVKSLLEHSGLLAADNVFEPEMASLEALLGVHSKSYVNRVMRASRGEDVADSLEYGIGTTDTPIFPGMHEATSLVVGGTLLAAQLVSEGTYTRALNLSGGLHHAQSNKGGGFCVYNDLSVAISYLRSRGLRVAYLDIDAHHGDGVQWIHYDDPNVLTISFHETGRYLYPGTGFVYELGRGEGLGTSLNVPLEPYTQNSSFLEALDRVLEPTLTWFMPDILVVQAGADAHFFDPLADLALTLPGYQELFKRIVQYAERFTNGRIVATGGGGYATWTAVPRVWGSLYAALSAQKLEYQLPKDWLDQWQPHSSEPLPETLDDPEPDIPRVSEINIQNSRTVTQLLELWRGIAKSKVP
jgi:acetoin utilization protein AcuC